MTMTSAMHTKPLRGRNEAANREGRDNTQARNVTYTRPQRLRASVTKTFQKNTEPSGWGSRRQEHHLLNRRAQDFEHQTNNRGEVTTHLVSSRIQDIVMSPLLAHTFYLVLVMCPQLSAGSLTLYTFRVNFV